MKTGLLIRQV